MKFNISIMDRQEYYSEELMYHCFPSSLAQLQLEEPSKLLEQRYYDCGLVILESIIKNGLLLTPEHIKIARHPGSEQENEDPIGIPQTRASFTLSSLEDLQKVVPHSKENATHMTLFGEFAIGLDPLAARDFDMAPTFYYYGTENDTRMAKNSLKFPLMSSLVHALTEVRELLSVLTLMQGRAKVLKGEDIYEQDKAASQFEDARISLLYQPKVREDKIYKTINELSIHTITQLLKALDTDRRPLGNLVEAIDLLGSLLQSTDSASMNSPLLYFSQREWRLVKVLNARVVGYDLIDKGYIGGPPTHVRQEALQTVFQAASLMDIPVDKKWLDSCWVVLASEVSDLFFRDYIRMITCPKSCLTDVNEIVQRYYPNPAIQPEIFAIEREVL